MELNATVKQTTLNIYFALLNNDNYYLICYVNILNNDNYTSLISPVRNILNNDPELSSMLNEIGTDMIHTLHTLQTEDNNSEIN